MKKYIILMLALTMVSPFTAFAHRLDCITNNKPFCKIMARKSVKYEEGKAIYGPTNYTLWRNNTPEYTSTDEEKVVALAISHAENGRCRYCIYSDGTNSFSTNGNEVDLNSLD